MISSSDSEYAALQRLDEWGGLSRIQAILSKTRRQPNFFSAAPRILRVEGVHSDILAWLLDSNSWHGLGDRFARMFAESVLGDCGLSDGLPVVVDEVHREFSTGRGPIDILLRARRGESGIVLGVENKIDSPESKDQLERYAAGLSQRFPQYVVVLAFLTPDGRKADGAPNCPLACIGYDTVVSQLESVVADPSVVDLARQYVAALRTHIMPETNPEIEAVCRKLYEEHAEAWRIIRRRLPSQRDEFQAAVGAMVCQRLQADGRGEWRFSMRHDKYSCVFRPEWFALGSYDADPIVGFDGTDTFMNRFPRLHLRLIADRADTDAGDEFGYEIRLKIDTRQKPLVAAPIVALLKASAVAPKIPDRDQFTITLKSTTRLPPVGIDAASVPDSVMDWYTRQIELLLPVLDSAIQAT